MGQVMNKIFLTLALLSLAFIGATSIASEEEHDPAEIAIGERLFLETRFSQAYFAGRGKGDSVMDKTETIADPLPGAFAGKTMNCRACHLVDEYANQGHNPVGGMRTYADFARRSPVPQREDRQVFAQRNSMSMLNISQGAYSDDVDNALFHHDGQFNSMSDLVMATLTGRNYGWLPGEAKAAITHIASVIRSDDGKGALAKEFGGRYKKILSAKDRSIPAEFKLSKEFAIDVDKATDQQLVSAVANIISAYVTDLAFSKNENNEYDGSAYDLFLQKNKLPRKPVKGETKKQYSQRLMKAVNKLQNPLFVKASEKKLDTHVKSYAFGDKALLGMKLFFRKGSAKQSGGNCVSCHSAPDFSDFKFHNTGLTQVNYDSLHGEGVFAKLQIPALAERNNNYNRYLPSTEQHPQAGSVFRQVASASKPGRVDLGLWNVFANKDMPAPQKKIRRILCQQAKEQNKLCSDQQLLELSVAAFKTPVLRDLEHSGPYFHNGVASSLRETLVFYQLSRNRALQTGFRNLSSEMQHIALNAKDVENLLAFLLSLNEDYD